MSKISTTIFKIIVKVIECDFLSLYDELAPSEVERRIVHNLLTPQWIALRGLGDILYMQVPISEAGDQGWRDGSV